MRIASTLLALVLAAVPSALAVTNRPTTPAPVAPATIPPATIAPPYLPVVNGDVESVIDRIGSCRTHCPNSLLCVGSHCLTPQPICNDDWGCSRGSYCDTPYNTTIIGAYNDAALAGKISLQRVNGQLSITIDASLTVNSGINFTNFIHHVHDGGYVDGICKPLTPVCNATSCGVHQVCAPYDGCKRCEVCGDDVDLTPILTGDFDPSSLSQRRNLTRGEGHGDRVGSGDLATVPDGYNIWANLTFGDDTDSRLHNGTCITTFVNQTWADIDHLFSNIEQAAVQIAQQARVYARDLAVVANSTLEIALAGDGAHCGANRSISLNGSLVIRGSATDDDVARGASGGRFDFPHDSRNNTIGTNAIVNVAGGVELTGDLGTLKLSVAASGTASASCKVPRNGTLHTSADVLGMNSEVTVYGSLNLTGSNFQPRINIPDGGNVTIDVGRDGNFTCGHLNLTRGGHVELHSHGNSTWFANFTCEWNSTLRIRVESIASLRNHSTVLFTYSTLDLAYRSSFHCHVELFDDNQTLPLINPNNVQASRRLLADAGTITWADNGAYATSSADSTSSTTATPIDNGSTGAAAATPTTPAPAATDAPVTSSTGGSKVSPNTAAAHATPAFYTIVFIMLARLA